MMQSVTKTRTTVTIDEAVLKAVRARATRIGKSASEVIEEAIRRDLGLGLMEQLWTRNDMSEKDAMELAVEAQLAARHRSDS